VDNLLFVVRGNGDQNTNVVTIELTREMLPFMLSVLVLLLERDVYLTDGDYERGRHLIEVVIAEITSAI